jgi:hypothetical protein
MQVSRGAWIPEGPAPAIGDRAFQMVSQRLTRREPPLPAVRGRSA